MTSQESRVVALPHEAVPGFEDIGFTAFTTTRDVGSFDPGSDEPAGVVVGRWVALLEALSPGVQRLACAHQVHGDRLLVHQDSWAGWLRDPTGADGHLTRHPGTAMAVTLADCVPVFLAHPSGACGILHSGWRGTAAGIARRGLEAFRALGLAPSDVRVHLGPAICGRCYEVGPEVYEAVTGRRTPGPGRVDLRAIIAAQVRESGALVSISPSCTRCNNDRFFSHRAGDAGRQVGVIAWRHLS